MRPWPDGEEAGETAFAGPVAAHPPQGQVSLGAQSTSGRAIAKPVSRKQPCWLAQVCPVATGRGHHPQKIAKKKKPTEATADTRSAYLEFGVEGGDCLHGGMRCLLRRRHRPAQR